MSIAILQQGWERRLGLRLPPGSVGWLPVVGETLEYCQEVCNLTGGPFMQRRMERYGSLFRSHLFGEYIIVSTDPKLNQFILQKEGILFKSSYPQSLLNIMGRLNTTEIHGQTHRIVRNAILNVVSSRIRSSENIRLISDIVLKKLDYWNNRTVKFQDEATHMSFCMVINQILGIPAGHPKAEILFEIFRTLSDGILRVPIDFPGTGYSRSMKAKKNLVLLIEEIIYKKEGNPERETLDVLDGLLDVERSYPTAVTRDVVIDVIIGVTFAAYETTSRIFAFAAKLIMDHPRVLKALQEEHFSIRDKIEGDEKHLAWEHYKSMSFTNKVVKETLRLVNAGELVFRESLKDLEIQGYLIPKGSKLMLNFIPAHVDPSKFCNPLAFNPWRWQEEESCEENFIAFGGGPRQCAGKDLARLEVSIFIHHLVTKCRWTQMEKEEVIRSRGPRFRNGLTLHFEKLM